MRGKSPSIIALIPARSGSKRVADKNIRPLAGHPVIAYTIAAARRSGIFSSVVVSTDSEEYARIARQYGAEVPFLRPAEIAGDESPDIAWIEFTLKGLKEIPSNGRGGNFFRRKAWTPCARSRNVVSIPAKCG
jgi:N-acylneuraminate cytidylyltransferase